MHSGGFKALPVAYSAAQSCLRTCERMIEDEEERQSEARKDGASEGVRSIHNRHASFGCLPSLLLT